MRRKFHPYSRRVFRRRFGEWAERNRRLLLSLTGGWIALLMFVTGTLMFFGPMLMWKWYLLGATHVFLVAVYLQFLLLSFLAHDREAIWHLRGAWGEDNTRDELKRARRNRLIWGCVDSINLNIGDVDHLVVTRAGGLVAMDSKWRSSVDRDELTRMANDARRSALRAEALCRSLLRPERGARHRAREQPIAVTPLVVVWGPAQHTVPENAVVEGVTFVAGRQLREWLPQLDGSTVDKVVAEDTLQRLAAFRAANSERTAARSS